MMNSISITVPLEHNALLHAANMLMNVAADLNRDTSTPDADLDTSGAEIERKIPVSEGGVKADNTPPPPKTKTDNVTSISRGKATKPPTESTTVVPPEGVKLDKEGLPWDGRIHGAKKAKTAKGLWKKIKNLEKNKPGLLAEVEAELKAGMAATTSPESTTATPPPPASTTPPPPASTVMPVMYLVNSDEFTAEQLQEAGWTDEAIAELPTTEQTVDSSDSAATVTAITFPEFMAKYTPAIAAGTITQEMVSAALTRQGLASIPLLASRPDLLPAVHAELFPS